MPDFQAVQAAFANHLRDPQRHPAPPQIEDRRMGIYRRLFINNIESFLSNAFPVIRQLYADADWHALVRSFYASHQSHRPQFYQVAEEFREYLETEHEPGAADPPFLTELAHYEWVEMILALDPSPLEPASFDPAGDPMRAPPLLSPWRRNLHYHYPVHQIGPDYRPDEPPPQPTFLLVFRQRDDRVSFLAVNALTSRLVDLIDEQPATSGQDLLLQLATEAQMDAAQALKFGPVVFAQFRDLGLLLGTRRSG